MTTITESGRPFVPGMGVEWLLPLYDPLTWLLGLDRTRQALVEQAGLLPRQQVLDIGCGTGSLAVHIKTRHPEVTVVGLDPDPMALARAARKARRAGVAVQFDRGYADGLRYPAASFDRVFSSFMLHHLDRDTKARALAEAARVLADGGSLHVMDFAAPDAGGRSPHGGRSTSRLHDNDAGTIVALMKEAGLANGATTAERRALGGWLRISYYRATKGPAR